MNKYATWVAVIILLIATIVYGILFVQTNDRINRLDTQAAELQSISTTVSGLQSQLNSSQNSITSLQSGLSAINSSISSLQGGNAQIQSQLSSLEAAVSQLASEIQTPSGNFADTVTKVEQSIVRVDTNLGSGSGIIIRANGYVLTNQHVIDQAGAIEITLMNGDVLPATIVDSDATIDVAVLKITSTRTDFPVVTIGSRSDFKVGDEVLVGGFPLGTDLPGPASFSSGIVSAIRNDPTVNIDYIQTDASVNPGNSGGGLFTLDGKMIGIPSYGIDPFQDIELINLAIPMEIASPFIQAAIGP